MAAAAIRFGTSGWRALIADEFTFANVRLAVTAIAEHVLSKSGEPAVLVAYDTRFYSEEFSRLAAEILSKHGVRALLCDSFAPTPAAAYEILRRKLTGAVNFTASHNPAPYHGLKFSSADGGPALPEVTKDIEARIAHLAAKEERSSAGGTRHTASIETVSIKTPYLERLGELVDFATAPGCTFLHRWQPGDVIMWDNRAVLHRGRPWLADKPRHMVRTTISATDTDGLAEMWPVPTAA